MKDSKTTRIFRCYWNRKKAWDLGSYKLGASERTDRLVYVGREIVSLSDVVISRSSR